MFRTGRLTATAMAFAFSTLLAATALAAGPLISMPAKSWSGGPKAGGVEYTCIVAACEKGAQVAAAVQPIIDYLEKEMNKPYFNPRAFANGGARYMESRGYGRITLTSIVLRHTKDYTAVDVVGTVLLSGKASTIAMTLRVQTNRAIIVASFAASSAMARKNLAIALKSGDFRRIP